MKSGIFNKMVSFHQSEVDQGIGTDLRQVAVFFIRVKACYIPFCLCFQQAFRLRKDLINFSSGRRVRTSCTADKCSFSLCRCKDVSVL